MVEEISQVTETRRVSRTDHGGVAVLLLDTPGQSMNVIDEELLGELRIQVERLMADNDIIAVVLGSVKAESFGAGADVNWLPTFVARADAEEYLESVHSLMYRIVASRRPFVAAVNGLALGGALELALACEAIVATPSASLGLPESSLGLIPGGAGTQLIRRWLNTKDSLELMLSARPLPAYEALARGLVSAIVEPSALLDAAILHASNLAAITTRRAVSVDLEDVARDVLQKQREVGPDRLGAVGESLIEVVSVGIERGPEAGCAAERQAFLRALRSSEFRSLRHLFIAEGDLRRRGRGSGVKARVLGVVGAGQMGSGIAATALSRGLDVHLRDVSQEKLDGAREYTLKVLHRVAADEHAITTAMKCLQETLDWEGFEDVDAVIEAVFELPELKTETLARVSDLVSPAALIATNTSAIPIHTLATAVSDPRRFIGTHFFSPVDRMPFVELVPHAATSSETIQRAAVLAGQLGKTSVVVADKPGFFTSRVYARWLIEGVRLLLDGAGILDIDSAARSVGFPVGPLQAHDEATLDLVMKASIIQVASTVMTDRLDVARIKVALQLLLDNGVLGRRQGVGFYRYEDGRRNGANEYVHEMLSVEPKELDPNEIRERLLLAFASECFLCWDDGTLCHPNDGDVAAVLAIGFPRTLGGPFYWADELGAAFVLSLCSSHGERAFTPGTSLSRLAQSGKRFHDEVRRDTPASSGG